MDEAAVQPLPNSRKIYVRATRPDIRVPMREISQAETPRCQHRQREPNPPIYVYDCSGPYTDPAVKIDIRSGLPALRARWIAERDDTETLAEPEFRIRPPAGLNDPSLADDAFPGLQRKPRRAKAGMNVTQMHYARARHHHAGDGIHRHPREPAPPNIWSR